MTEFYRLKLGPISRNLPIITLPSGTKIASFNLLGDAEVTTYAATELLKELATINFDYLVTTEAKGVPLAIMMASLAHQSRYVVLRKHVKDYMVEPREIPVKAITTATPQELVLDGTDARLLKGKRVAFVDDVISQGGSLKAAESLMTQAGADMVARLAILTEGEASQRSDVISLSALPIIAD